MAEEDALNVVHADAVARIAERVARGVAGGRYVCSCASPELRVRIEAALAVALGGPEKVVSIDVSDGDPWNTLRRRQVEERLPTGGTLFTMVGFSEAARRSAERGGKHPYEQLNLARDGLASTGSHVLFWLEAIGEIEAFAQGAPDLWTFRTLVVPFLSEADFSIEWTPPEDTRDDARLREIEWQLAQPGMEGVARVQLLDRKAILLLEDGRAGEARKAVELARDGIPTVIADRAPWSLIRRYVGLREFSTLRSLARLEEARSVAADLLAQAGAGGWALEDDFREQVASSDWTLGWGQRAQTGFRSLLAGVSTRDGTRALACINYSHMLVERGRINEARSALVDVRDDDEQHRAARSRILASISGAAGDCLGLLANAARAINILRTLGSRRLVAGSLKWISRAFDDLGLSEARTRARLSARLLSGDPRPLLDEVASTSSEPGTDPRPMWDDAREALKEASRRSASGEEVSSLVDALQEIADDAAPPWKAEMFRISIELLHQVQAPKPDPYGLRGRRRYLLARAYHGLGQLTDAVREATEAAAWARAHRGPSIQSDVWRFLSNLDLSRGDGRAALKKADRALTLAREDGDNLRAVMAQEDRAKALVALAKVAEARGALEDALAVVRPEGLRPVELRLLHEIAELPSGAGRADVAHQALLLSRELMFPREEARALLNLARLALARGERSAQVRAWLDRAWMWTSALGPIDRLEELRALRERLAQAPILAT